MIKQEINELKRLYTPSNCSITRICGCYVDGEKNKKTEFKEAFLSLPEEEIFKYLFIETKEEDQYVIDIIDRDVLYKRYKGAGTNYTLKFNGDFIKYKASALATS